MCKAPKIQSTPPWNKGLSKHSDQRLMKLSLDRTGDKNKQWRGGVAGKHRSFYKNNDYKRWRMAVFKRDRYTCQTCGQIGGALHADHIKCFAHHAESRLNLNNGRTLCEPCHKQTDNYGNHRRNKCITDV